MFSEQKEQSFPHPKIWAAGLTWIGILFLSVTTGCVLKQPSNNRNWSVEHAILPQVHFAGNNHVVIDNVRNFRYSAKDRPHPNYETKYINLNEISTVDYFVTYFLFESSFFAHSMLSFGNFQQDDFTLISIEARREQNEKYSFRAATGREFELIYVIADERDMIDLRAIMLEEKVFRYRLGLDQKQAQRLFTALLKDADRLNQEPKFYQLFKNNCTTNLVEYAGEAIPNRIDRELLNRFPGYAHFTLRNVGLIDNSLSVKKQRECARVNELARQYRDSPFYSNAIRRQWR